MKEATLPIILPPRVHARIQALDRDVIVAQAELSLLVKVRDQAIWAAIEALGYEDLSHLNVDIPTGVITQREDA